MATPTSPPDTLVPDARGRLSARYEQAFAYARRTDYVPATTDQLLPVDVMGALVLRDEQGNATDLSELHRSWSWFIHYAWSNNRYAGILAPWRHGKTMLGTIRYGLWEIGKNPELRVRLLAADDREAMQRVKAMGRYITESPEYKLIFPDIQPDRKANWNEHQLYVKRKGLAPDPTLHAAAAFSSEAGGGNDLILVDDACTYQNSILQPPKREKIYQALTSVWLRRVQPETRVLLVGTAWHEKDAYSQLRALRGGKWLWLIQAVGPPPDFAPISSVVEG